MCVCVVWSLSICRWRCSLGGFFEAAVGIWIYASFLHVLLLLSDVFRQKSHEVSRLDSPQFRCWLDYLIRLYASLVFCQMFLGKPRQYNRTCVSKYWICGVLISLPCLETGPFLLLRASRSPTDTPAPSHQEQHHSTVCSPLRKWKFSSDTFYLQQFYLCVVPAVFNDDFFPRPAASETLS